MVMVKTPPKDIRLATTFGHVIQLPASSTKDIPKSVLQDALARGCAIADEDFEQVEEAKPVFGKESMNRKAEDEVEVVIRAMIEDKKPNEWTNGGRPDAKAISRRRKARVDAKLRDKVWSERFGDS